MAPEPISVVVNGVNYVPEPVTVVPATDTVVPATDPVKQRIVDTFPRSNIKIDDLKKVVSHDMKNLERLGKRRVLTLDDGKRVIFNYASSFYTVSKDDNKIAKDSVQNSANEIEDGSIFDKYDVYADTTPSENNVFEPTIISGGGSRKKYRKSSRRVKSAKKSSRTRKFRNRK